MAEGKRMTMVTRQHVAEWLDELKVAWEGKNPDRVLQLFKDTKRYYERPFHPGTSQEEYRTYWELIVSLYDIRFEYDIIAIEGEIACIHWQNWFRESPEGKLNHVDGVFIIIFNTAGSCEQFSQWWFMEK
jgi:SnoaL-like domain